METKAIALVLLSLSACLSEDKGAGRVDVIPDPDGLEVTSETSVDGGVDATTEVETEDTNIEIEVEDTSIEIEVEDTSIEIEVEDTSIETEDTSIEIETGDTSIEVGSEVEAPVCGDGLVEGDEACDDGDGCDGDGCAGCGFEPALALVELELDAGVGWDLDDADGDGDPETGIDNRLGSSSALRLAMSIAVGQPVARGDILLLAILGDVDSLEGDPAARLALVSGASDCPTASPPAWLVRADPPATVRRDPAQFEACVAATTIDDGDDPDNGILAGPPRLRFWTDTIELALGGLGALRVTRSRLEGALALDDGELRGLDDGRIGGIVPARALARIDTSGLTPLCPTALHATLGLAGHIDQDAEGNGGKDFILWTTSAGLPCVTAPVTIVGCCDEGDCTNGRIDGAGCVTDPRIGDGFSAGFRVTANAVRVVGPTSATCGP